MSDHPERRVPRTTETQAMADDQLRDDEREWKALAEDPRLWPEPWAAHTFEIDCPCPNGAHCGDTHSCEEVDSPEAYPDSPEEPAEPGKGQCVVQISVPGLESLSRPTAAFIAAARTAVPELLRRLAESRETVGRLLLRSAPETPREDDALRRQFEEKLAAEGRVEEMRRALRRVGDIARARGRGRGGVNDGGQGRSIGNGQSRGFGGHAPALRGGLRDGPREAI